MDIIDFATQILQEKKKCKISYLCTLFFYEEYHKQPTLDDEIIFENTLQTSIKKAVENWGVPIEYVGTDEIILVDDTFFTDDSSLSYTSDPHEFAAHVGKKLLTYDNNEIVKDQKKTRDGGWDFLGFRYEAIGCFHSDIKILTVGQVKRYQKGKVTVEEVREFYGAIEVAKRNRLMHFADSQIIIKLFVAPAGFTEDAKKVADALDITLVTYSTLKQYNML